MRQLLRKFHLGGNHYDRLESERILDARGASADASSSTSSTPAEHRTSSGFSAWFSSVGRHGTQSATSSNQVGNTRQRPQSSTVSTGGDVDVAGRAASPAEVDTTELDFQFLEEEYQLQLAMALSMSKDERPDPEMLEIEAVKKISLGLGPTPSNSPVEALAYRYWAYHVLDYDDRVVDGFYDVYGVSNVDTSDRMPSLFDLQGAALSESNEYEVILVNRVTDYDLVKLEKRVMCLALEPGVSNIDPLRSGLVQKIADVVAEQMGGPVASDVELLAVWKTTSWELKSFAQNIVLPLGALQIGLARHRALLFKVLADCVGIPCKLVKGRYYIGVDDGAVNILKDRDDREFIVDLIGAPGALIPLDSILNTSISDQIITLIAPTQESLQNGQPPASEQKSSDFGQVMLSHQVPEDSASTCAGREDSGRKNEKFILDDISYFPGSIEAKSLIASLSECDYKTSLIAAPRDKGKRSPARGQLPPRAVVIVSPPGFQINLTDLSPSTSTTDLKTYGPDTALNLADLKRDEGEPSPLNSKSSSEESCHQSGDGKVSEDKKGVNERKRNRVAPRHKEVENAGPGWSPVRVPRQELDAAQEDDDKKLQRLKSFDHLDDRQQLKSSAGRILTDSSSAVTSVSAGRDISCESSEIVSFSEPTFVPSAVLTFSQEKVTVDSNVIHDFDSKAQCSQTTVATVNPVTSAMSNNKACNESVLSSVPQTLGSKGCHLESDEADATSTLCLNNTSAANDQSHCGPILTGEGCKEDQRYSLASGRRHQRFESMLGDAAEWEILWEDLILGERIGLGSYGEVYHGDWHGTEVAVKKFLDQDISGDALEEFRREVRIMRRLRHPNVVLFMGAVARAPNLSIVTEFLPRGSLYRLIHRPNNELDERRRLRMALDVVRGMNYLHNSTPVIVHRDLKSPNLLVDKNWVVKVCDFGLSRMKHNTFLSSMSTAGTPEWMAPEVLRNEPSNEKSDVYSFGVILWELATSQQPWSGLNPMQVVGAVGFQHRQLQIPEDTDPQIAQIIRDCWQNDPSLRPSFSQIMSTLKPLQRPVLAPQPYDYYRHIPQ